MHNKLSKKKIVKVMKKQKITFKLVIDNTEKTGQLVHLQYFLLILQ